MKTVTIENEFIKLTCLSQGATIISFEDKKLKRNLITSFEEIESYRNDQEFYLGTTVAPTAGRISQGQFVMDNRIIQLEINNGPHHLHGGSHGLSSRELNVTQSNERLEFRGSINHQIDGYPGSVDYLIVYELKDNQLIIEHHATPFTKMPLNMANHMYFNLEGSDSILDHELMVNADKLVLLDETGAPGQVLLGVKNTVFDFRNLRPLNQLLKGHPQFEISRLLDHAFIFNDDKHISLQSKELSLDIETTSDSVVLYTSNFFDGQFVRDNHRVANNYQAIAIETQKIPNGVNTTLDEQPFHSPENPYYAKTTYTITRRP